ncbi:MAG: aminodeoxychorismate synthase component I [Campylobacteraceae bacterium]|nr:aminodeoxychorismate synthase component I [Campylobacteraceae bacterium]
MLDITKEKLNNFSQKGVPFIAVLGYGENDLVCELKDAKKFGVEFKFSEFKLHQNLTYSLNLEPISFEKYKECFDKTLNLMKENGVSLLNLCFETPAKTSLSLDEIYNYSSANLVLKFKNFVCFSPEIFVEISGDKISTHPMKGTIDASLPNAKEILLNDKKELNEQTLMCELMLDELSLVADSVKVDKFRYISEISTKDGKILQTSSKISGNLKGEFKGKFGDIFEKLLPAGSISGAPKEKACKIIKGCELVKRGFYSGVFIYYDGKSLKSWVLIRFIEKRDETFVFKTGGGITEKSVAKKEYDEMLKKAYFTF